ncbi:MAG: PAS domain S-box protein, partial [Candidatus Loosdrechtia sp.]|uniref:PAS domain S-box protein n=1 Tax=Candidatus Loosdrechtia sp. TaxID=3101272 RepID=UPI00403AA954
MVLSDVTIFDTVSVLIVVLDTAGNIVYFNRTGERVTGYSLMEVKGKCFWELFLVPEEIDTFKAVFENLQKEQLQGEKVSTWLTKNGDRRLIEWSNTTLFKNASVEYIIITGTDITVRRKE